MKKKKANYKWGLGVIGTIALGLFLVLTYSLLTLRSKSIAAEIVNAGPTAVVAHVRTQLSNHLTIHFDSEPSVGYLHWREAVDQPFYSLEGTGVHSTEKVYDLPDMIQPAQAHQIVPLVDSIMKKLGATVRQANSSPTFTNTFFTNYQKAYELGKILCILEMPGIDPVSSDSVTFKCSDELAVAKQDQTKFLTLIDEPTRVARPYLQKDNFYYVSMYDVRFGGGWYVIAYDTGSELIELFHGQEAPTCELVDKWKIPKEITDECWATQSRSRPNTY